MIVEDDADVRTALGQLFSSQGYEVGLASDGAEGIAMLDTNPHTCVVVVDLLMPGIVGHELLDYMRGDPDLAKIPVAIISGSPQLAPEGYQVFPKPLDSRALLAFVKQGCEHRHASRRPSQHQGG
jgi:CheY-like chemotaxis protein